MDILDILGATARQNQSTSTSITEESLAADEAVVQQEVNRLQGDVGGQRSIAAMFEKGAQEQDNSAREALSALIANDEAQANLKLSEYNQAQDRLANRDRIGEQIKQAYGVEMQLDLLRPDLSEMQAHLDQYRDKLIATENETAATKNPLKWAWNELAQKPYYQKKVQEAQQQIINTVGTAAKVMVGANNAQAVADSFTATADNQSVQADQRNAIDAAQAASSAQHTSEYFSDRQKQFAARYSIRADLAQQQNSLVRTLADIYTSKRAARTSATSHGDDLLKILKLQEELGNASFDPGTIQLLSANGIDFNEATTMGAGARGALVAHITSGLPLVFTQGVKDEDEIGQLLANGIKASKYLPDPLQGYFADQVYRQAAAEMQTLKGITDLSGKDAKTAETLKNIKFVKYTKDITGKIKITGLDFSGALDKPGQFSAVGEAFGDQRDAGSRSISDLYSNAALRQPGSAMGKMILASADIQAFAKSEAPGAKLARQIIGYADKKTEDGRPVLPATGEIEFDQLLKFANGDTREVYGFYEQIRKAVAKKLPYGPLGAEPVAVAPRLRGRFLEPGFFGNETKVWEQEVRSVEDVNKLKIRQEQTQKMYEEFQKRQMQDANAASRGILMMGGN